MNTWLPILFWISLGLLCYTYIGYGILVWLLVKVKSLFTPKKTWSDPVNWPTVAVIVTAYNEAECITEKIRNTLALDYPEGQLEFLFVTDGSTDNTPELIRGYPQIRLLHQAERRGKTAAIQRALGQTRASILVFSDANALIHRDSIRAMVRHYADPKVCGVAGEKKVAPAGHHHASATGEGYYWKYESLLKQLDAELNCTMGAAGELYSMRRELMMPISPDTILEDFIYSLMPCTRGYVLQYEPGAWSMEGPSLNLKEEFKRKVRICAGSFQAMYRLRDLFNIFRHPVTSFQFISHRVLRWTIGPPALVILLCTNALLVLRNPGTNGYAVFLVLQVLFYVMGITGLWIANRNLREPIFYIPAYFLMMNTAVVAGFVKFIQGGNTPRWEKSVREKFHPEK